MNTFKPEAGMMFRIIVLDNGVDALVFDRSYTELGPALQDADRFMDRYSGDDR